MKFTQGNRIQLFKNGGALFPALAAAIETAERSVRIETYIFADDASGQKIARSLAAAAARGVEVQLLVDGFGSLKTPERFFDAMRSAGVQILFYRPLRGKWIPTRSRMRRMHRKIALIDGRIGFVGGINFIDDFNENLSDTAPRYDYAVSVEGPVLQLIYGSVYRLWRSTKWFTNLRRQHDGQLPEVTSSPVGVSPLAFVARDNVQYRRNIERAYRAAINVATSDVLIASSYFLPGLRLRHALIAAAKRGVKVEILLQGAADHPLLQMATRSLYGTLLEAGISIYEYTPAMLHAKVAVIDSRWATVGSSNLDPFSLVLNREANIISLDPVFAAALEKSLREEISDHTVRLDRQAWSQRGIGQKMVSWFALGVIRVASLIFGVAAE